MTADHAEGRIPDRLDLGSRSLPDSVSRQVHRIAPGGRLHCTSAPWNDALVLLETGCVELSVASGAGLHLCQGAIFALRGLIPAVLRPTEPGSAVIVTLHRRPRRRSTMTTESVLQSDPAEFYRRVAGAFTARVEGTADWDAPAPVTGWRARDVVGHLVEWFPGFLASGAGITLRPGPSVADDPVGAWRAHSDQVQALLEDPATADRVLSNPHIGELPLGPAVSQFYTADVFMHTWDLARATGQDETLDPALCAELLAGMEPMDELLRSSGQYGPRVPVPDDADVQTRLLAFIGRDPLGWRAPSA